LLLSISGVERAYSPYNAFMKTMIAELKVSNPNMEHKQHFKTATEAWRSYGSKWVNYVA
jgi:hypothetical protein